MIDFQQQIQRIFIEERSLKFPLSQKVLKKLSSLPVKVIKNEEEVIEGYHALKDPIGEGKKALLLKSLKGDFVKPCPCTPHYIGCNYYIINTDLNCPMDCSYCILQHYLDNPLMTIHVNTDDLWQQLDEFLFKHRNRFIRIGTGELGDSLALDPITERSKELISFFRRKNRVNFELKTKSLNIENILNEEPAENIIIAWSLNTEFMAEKEEKKAPSVKDRIEAAFEVQKRGFRVAFHFDPLILYSGWEQGYHAVIKSLFTRINPDRIAWISLGSLRFPKPLKGLIRKRFPSTKIIYQEMIRGIDEKLRYFKPLRIKLYQEIVKAIRSCGNEEVPLYFCMESKEIWEKVLNREPGSKEEVEAFLSLLPRPNEAKK
ncbi:MAG: radical SAM protein [Acidobacteriota bacterium]